MKVGESETCESFSHCYFLMVAIEEREDTVSLQSFFCLFIFSFKISFFWRQKMCG